MEENSFDANKARHLGHDIASHSHEALPKERIEELSGLIEEIEGALASESGTVTADSLLNFWAGHVAGDLEMEVASEAIAPEEKLFENGLKAGALGVDLYQALIKTTRATDDGSERPDLAKWTDRLFELTNRHVAHLEAHE